MTTLFINACVRENSRTLRLARHLLDRLGGDITELNLMTENILPLNRDSLTERDTAIHRGTFDSPELRYARQFAAADIVVIAAPFWDLSFPALLKCYLETITVSGVTFTYVNGIPQGLCRAKKLYFVTSCGGSFVPDFGYNYICALARDFYGIPNTVCYAAEGLDIDGADVEANLAKAMAEIDSKENTVL